MSLTGKNSGQVDLAAATAQGILVTQTEGSGATAIEMTMALMLAMAHRVAQEDRAMREGLWQTGIGIRSGRQNAGHDRARTHRLANCSVWKSSGHEGAGLERRI